MTEMDLAWDKAAVPFPFGSQSGPHAYAPFLYLTSRPGLGSRHHRDQPGQSFPN